MEKLRIKDLKSGLYLGDLGEYFNDYDNGYICDIIAEIADNNIDIYTSDLFEWAAGNCTLIEEALDELGTPTDNNGNADFLKIIQQGQYYANECDLYDNLEEALKFYMYDYIEKTLEVDEITENQNDSLLEFDFSDNNERLENLVDHINEVMKTNEEV